MFSEGLLLQLDGPYIWHPSDDVVMDFFIHFEDDLSHHTQSDFHSSFDGHPFEDAYFFYKEFHPLCLDFDRYHVMARPRQSEVHSTKKKFCHLRDSHWDLRTKRIFFLLL
jgi:hypothetical protein